MGNEVLRSQGCLDCHTLNQALLGFSARNHDDCWLDNFDDFNQWSLQSVWVMFEMSSLFWLVEMVECPWFYFSLSQGKINRKTTELWKIIINILRENKLAQNCFCSVVILWLDLESQWAKFDRKILFHISFIKIIEFFVCSPYKIVRNILLTSSQRY